MTDAESEQESDSEDGDQHPSQYSDPRIDSEDEENGYEAGTEVELVDAGDEESPIHGREGDVGEVVWGPHNITECYFVKFDDGARLYLSNDSIEKVDSETEESS